MATVILENVRVDFPIYGAHRNLRQAIFQKAASTAIFHRATGGLIYRQGRDQKRIIVRALSDVSMTLEDGDRIGLVGHNGSGKSTLLKVIAGIYEPIAGRMFIEGRVTPLFDTLPGLDPEDTGYENILTAGMLLGMSRSEIENNIQEIEEFSGLGEYLSLPVRTYSAGMTTRLGFAVVTSVNPDILLMDEGIGTADLAFTERAEERLNHFMSQSRIIVLASHAQKTVESICNKAALMREGQILRIGPVKEIFGEYHSLVHGSPERAMGDIPEVKQLTPAVG